jgi:CDP-glucose 4,6-dehydratase
LASALLEKSARVVCLERDETQPNSLDVLGLRSKATVVRGDLQDLELMRRVLNEFEIDAVFHLAAQAIVGAANRSPISTFESNIRGTYMLLEACRLSEGVNSIVVASSDKAYGSHAELPYREDFPLQGVFPYDVSKSCTDLIARSFAVTYGLPVAVTRSANIYGPADLNLSRIIPGTIVSVLRGEDPVVRSDGTPIREFVHTDDVCSAYLTLAENIEKVSGEAFNIGTNDSVKILDLTNKIIDLAGVSGRLRPNVLLKDKIKHEIDAQYLSADKIKTRLGWTASVSLDVGLRQTIEWYNQNIERLA